MFVFLEECDACGSLEERVFTDSWSGKELCLNCLTEVVGEVTMSPNCGDNLLSLLIEKGIIEDIKEELIYTGWIY